VGPPPFTPFVSILCNFVLTNRDGERNILSTFFKPSLKERNTEKIKKREKERRERNY